MLTDMVTVTDTGTPVKFVRCRPDPRVVSTFAAFLVPAVGRRVLARRRDAASAEEAARSLLRLCCADPDRVPADIVDLHIELADDLGEQFPVGTAPERGVQIDQVNPVGAIALPGQCGVQR